MEKSFKQTFKDNVWHDDGAWIKIFLIGSSSLSFIIWVFEWTLFAIFMKQFSDVSNEYLLQSTKWKDADLFQYLLLRNTIIYIEYLAKQSKDGQAIRVLISDDFISGLAITIMGFYFFVMVFQVFVGYKLKYKFQRSKAEQIGNNTKLKKADFIFNLHRDCLMLYFVFCPGCSIYHSIVAGSYLHVRVGFIVSIFVAMIVPCVADFAACREKKGWLILSMIGRAALEGFTIYGALFQFVIRSISDGLYTLVIFEVFALLLPICCSVLSILVIRNFKLGLCDIYSKQDDWLHKSDRNRDRIDEQELEDAFESSPLDVYLLDYPFGDYNKHNHFSRNDLKF